MTLLFIGLLVSVLINAVLFIIAFRYKTDRLTDASYALSFIALAMIGYYTHMGDLGRLLLLAFIVLWAGRLGSFLLLRIWHKKVDHRFDGMRDSFFAFGRFWVAQAFSVWVILIPSLLAFSYHSLHITTVSLIGCVIWGTGLMLESQADKEKFQFSQDPANKGKWIDDGVWRYSRHPNYMGEMMIWIGIYCYVAPSLTPLQLAVGVLSPLFIIGLLLGVSGIPILEKRADEKWGKNPDYQAYKRRTSILVPWPPKSQ